MLNFRSVLFSLTALCLALPAHSAIFGRDDRTPVTPKSPFAPLARSTAIAVLSANVSESTPGHLKLDVNSMSEVVCKDERFSTDPSLSWACTGFMVAPDLLVTAGHCSVNTGESRHETETYCQTFSWLFDYQSDEQGRVQLDQIPSEKLYRCKETIYAVKEETPPFRDFALIRLERPVVDRTPLKLSHEAIQDKTKLSMIGYPLGTPAKRSWGARVILNNTSRQSFVTNLDAFEGNSGSPVFNEKQEVVGILVAGTPSISFYQDKAKSCSRYNTCAEDATQCRLPDPNTSVFPGFQTVGSEVQRIQAVIDLIRETTKSDP